MGYSVSVVIPTYNDSSERLEKTVLSVLSQSFTDCEIIVVDDGSNRPFDGLDEKLNNPRIKWVRLIKNSGVAAARNEAIRNADGEFIAFLDAGDWWEPAKLALQVKLFINEKTNPVLVYCDALKLVEGLPPLSQKANIRGNAYKSLLVNQIITGGCSAVIAKKSAIAETGGFYTQEDISEDWDMWLKLARIGDIDFVPQPLTNIEVRSDSRGSFSRARNLRKEERLFGFLRIHESEIRENGLWQKAVSTYHGRISEMYFNGGNRFLGFKNAILAFLYMPSFQNLKAFISGIIRSVSPRTYWHIKTRLRKGL